MSTVELTELERLHAAIATLGNDEDEIAESLEAKDITGIQLNEGCCPIANYLTGCGFEDVRVMGDVIETRYSRMDPTPAVNEFIECFDAGGYPELIDDDEDFE